MSSRRKILNAGVQKFVLNGDLQLPSKACVLDRDLQLPNSSCIIF